MIFAKGTSLTWNGNAVAKLTSVGTPELSVDNRDVTTHDSTSRLREFAAGLVDAGNVPVQGYFDATDTTGQQAMFTDCKAGTTRTAVITGPDSVFSMTFSAYISNIKLVGDAPVDGHFPFTATLKVTGDVTLGISSSTGLTTLTVSNSGVITPSFSGSVYQYAVTFATSISSFTMTPTAAGQTIEITANGVTQTVTSGQASSAISLGSAGSVTEVSVKVTQTSKVPKIYKFLAIRE